MADDTQSHDNGTSNEPEVLGETSSIDQKSDVSATEITPLLSPPVAGSVCDISTNHHSLSPRVILFAMGLVVLLLQCGDQLLEAPQIRVFESIYCYQYWEKADPSKLLLPRSAVGPGALGGVEEQWCKVAEVQAKVANLKGTQTFLDGFPSLLLAIPVGILADRWGRKPVILIGLLANPLKPLWIQVVCWFWQTFDIRLSWMSALNGVFGASSPVLSAMLFVVISDVSDQEKRAAAFLRIVVGVLLANFFMPAFSAYLMTLSPWVALLVGDVAALISIPVMVLIPETLGYSHPSLKPRSKPAVVDDDDEATTPGTIPTISTENFVNRWSRPLLDATRYFFKDWRLPGLLMTFALSMLMYAANPSLLQYCSTRYEMTFSRATVLLSIKNGFIIFVFLVVQPLLSRMLSRAGMGSMKVDLVLARGSMLVLCLGWTLIGLSPDAITFSVSLLVMVVGAGFPMFIRSFLTGLVDPSKVAELFTMISIIDTVGLMTGGPLLAWLFENGLRLGGLGLGIPFLAIGLLSGLTTIFVFCVKHEEVGVVVEDEQQGET